MKNSPASDTFCQFYYDTKPKHESKAREIGRAEETEMNSNSVEDRQRRGCLGSAPARKPKHNATKHGKRDLRTMANIGRRCAKEVSEVCILDQNCPPFTILASAEAVDLRITDDFGHEVERRSTPRNCTAKRTPPFET